MRGDARTELSPFLVESLARAASEVLGADGFAVARDTRESGNALAQAIHAGVAASGGHSSDLGVIPTPAVALWCRDLGVPGAVVSASHNPWYDNGVKFFAAGGLKLDDETQAEIQRRFDRYLADGPNAADTRRTADQPSPVGHHEAAVVRHTAHVVASLQGRSLQGMKLVVDVANGAATTVAHQTFEALGAEVEVMHCRPDGRNINASCGSTHPESLQRAVVEAGADAGIAFDGDADRLIAVDESGELVDGDRIIAMCALDRHQRGELQDGTVVVTVMTNLGFRRSMSAAGIEIIETGVGDRYVLEALDRHDLSLGGEQSGHVIFRDLATTGDGLLTAVQVLDVAKRSGRSFGELAAESMHRLPQILVNVEIAQRAADIDHQIEPIVAPFVDRLGGRGRVLVRPSGTEPLVRVMVEAETDAEAAQLAHELAAEIASSLG